jgi:hypothetical protein
MSTMLMIQMVTENRNRLVKSVNDAGNQDTRGVRHSCPDESGLRLRFPDTESPPDIVLEPSALAIS